MASHVCRPALPACRLAESFTWDSLLSSVANLCISYKLARGPWIVGLEAAAARLAGSMGTEIDEHGFTSVTSPGGGRGFKMGDCRAQCGACSACLEAEQVLSRPAAIKPDFLLILSAWHMPYWMSDM